MKVRSFFLLIAVTLSLFHSAALAETGVRCASTTNIQSLGLFGHILPLFEKKTGIKVDVIAVGEGDAVGMGKRGDADVVFVRSKDQETEAVEQGYFVNRRDVMYNDFVLIGPPDDPAKVKGVKSAAAAFLKVAQGNALFVSRSDKSDTHLKELALWQKAGTDPRGKSWYLEVGQGMEKAQRMAGEKRAYTLTDRGTWLATKDRLGLIIVFEGDPELFNQYGVMAVSPGKHKHVKYKESMKFIEWLISKEGQQAIASFKDKNGNQLFIPNARRGKTKKTESGAPSKKKDQIFCE